MRRLRPWPILVALLLAIAGCTSDVSPPSASTSTEADQNEALSDASTDGGLPVQDDATPAEARYALQIVSLWVSHGDATLIFLPSGEIALVDTGQDFAVRELVLPFLERHGIRELDYLIVTHYDGDHASGKRDEGGRVYLGSPWDSRRIPVRTFWDYGSFHAGDRVNFGGTEMLVLNSAHENPSGGENHKSLSIHLTYEGFTYALGGDVYREQQERIMRDFPESFPVHVYRTNHHMHGSVSREYLVRSNPFLFVTSAEHAVYDRSAYTDDFAWSKTQLRNNGGRLIDSLLTLEDGNIVVSANEADDWTYETFAFDATIPELVQEGHVPNAPQDIPAPPANADLSTYPSCTSPSLSGSSFSYAYMPLDAPWGYMQRKEGDGISCRVRENASAQAYPLCETACAYASQTASDWGWCPGLEGFHCVTR